LALIGTVAIGGMAILLLQRAKTEFKIGKRLGADNDIEIAVAAITATLASPMHCSATLRGLSFPTGTLQPLNQIRLCTSGTCASGASYADYMGPETGGTWRLDRRVSATVHPTSARIKDLKYQLYKVQQRKYVADSAGGDYDGVMPAVVRIYITFEKNLGATAAGARQTSSGGTITSITHPKVYTVDAMVVTHSYNYTTGVLTPLSSIAGCARSSGSTVVY